MLTALLPEYSAGCSTDVDVARIWDTSVSISNIWTHHASTPRILLTINTYYIIILLTSFHIQILLEKFLLIFSGQSRLRFHPCLAKAVNTSELSLIKIELQSGPLRTQLDNNLFVEYLPLCQKITDTSALQALCWFPSSSIPASSPYHFGPVWCAISCHEPPCHDIMLKGKTSKKRQKNVD